MLQYVEIAYHYEERQKGEYDEELHRLGVRFAVVLVLRLAEHERFVGIAERLGYHSHNHGYLRCGAINAELGVSVAAFVDVGEENLVGSLVENAGYAEYEYRPRVGEHAAQQCLVKLVFDAHQLLPEEERERCRAEKVDIEGIASANGRVVYLCDESRRAVAFVYGRQHEEEHQIERYRHEDVQKLQGSELDRAFLVSQIGEWYALEGIYRHRDSHHPDVRRVVGVAHER